MTTNKYCDHPTLNRFYSFHYTFPFILAGLSIFHIAALHQYGSTNPLGINTQGSTIPFGPYFGPKDLLGVLFLLLAFAYLVFFYPEWLGQLLFIALLYAWMAVMFGNKHYNHSAICWKNLSLNTTRVVSVLWLVLVYFMITQWSALLGLMLILNPYSVTKYANVLYYNGQSAGNLYMLYAMVGSSETTRATPSKKNNKPSKADNVDALDDSEDFSPKQLGLSDYEFNFWLAGLVEGDGTLGVTKTKPCAYFEVTLDNKDVQTLHFIKRKLGYGNISKRTGVKAYRIRTAQQANLIDLMKRLNGKFLTTSKQVQLIKVCNHFHMTPIIPTKVESINIIKNTSWLSGFFDAEGFFNIMNKTTLAFHIGQKDKLILELILEALQFGHIRLDTSNNCWIYSITDKTGINFIVNKFKNHNLHTLKQIDVYSLSRLLYEIEKGHHLKSSQFHGYVMNLISLFKNRNFRDKM